MFMGAKQVYTNNYELDTKGIILASPMAPSFFHSSEGACDTLATCQPQVSRVLDFLSDKCDRQSNPTRNALDL